MTFEPMKIITQSRTEELTPAEWLHVGIYEDGGFVLRGRCHSMPWFPADLKALGLNPRLKTRGIAKLADAIATGGKIESAMENRKAGGLHLPTKESAPVDDVAPDETPATDDDPASGLVASVGIAATPATPAEQALDGSRDSLAKLMEGKKVPDPAKASLPPAFLAPLPDPKQPELF